MYFSKKQLFTFKVLVVILVPFLISGCDWLPWSGAIDKAEKAEEMSQELKTKVESIEQNIPESFEEYNLEETGGRIDDLENKIEALNDNIDEIEKNQEKIEKALAENIDDSDLEKMFN